MLIGIYDGIPTQVEIGEGYLRVAFRETRSVNGQCPTMSRSQRIKASLIFADHLHVHQLCEYRCG